jgi:predicted PurR-regulated permease PerM
VIALVLGQILDEVILPKVIGGIVGVNPIWLIIAVFLGARLGGVMGILLAVPVASVIKDLVDDMIASSRQESTPDALEAEPPGPSELPPPMA